MSSINRRGSVFLMAGVALWLGIFSRSATASTNNQQVPTDLLAYTLTNYDEGHWQTSLLIYDPLTHTSTPFLEDYPFRDFSFSPDGRLAYQVEKNGYTALYVKDALSDSPPINVSLNFTQNHYPLSWSRDGRYLAFEVEDNGGNKRLYVRNNQAVYDITPTDLRDMVNNYGVDWSYDDRLAFNVWYTSSFVTGGYLPEIYLWDGQTTSNLSQNPTGGAQSPAWNTEGELAFLAYHDDEADIFIWDGTSVKNGLPDKETFINAAPKLTMFYSSPSWTSNNLLAFTGSGPEDANLQVYVWDGQTATNISQNPAHHSGGAVWNSTGEWAYILLYGAVLYIQDVDNNLLLKVKGQYPPAWSPNGYLAFCARTLQGEWELSLWDGEEVIQITQGGEILAQWQNGSGVVCSNG